MWKRSQEKRKINSRIKLAFAALLILVLLLFFAKILSFTNSLNFSLNSDQPSNNISWDGKSALNILFVQNSQSKPDLSVINFQSKTKSVTILHLSDQIYTELPKNYGSWRLGSVYKLGEEEKPGFGTKLLKLSIAKLVGLPLDGIIFIDNQNKSQEEAKAEDIIAGWHKNPLALISFVGSIKTDLKTSDLIQFLYKTSWVRSDKVISLDMAQSTLTKSQLLPDSSRVLGIDNVKMDIFIRDNLQDAIISDEALTVGIFNATNHRGLAQEVARIITNMGANVVFTTNTNKLQSTSKVISDPTKIDKKYQTPSRITQVFAPACLKKPCLSQDPDINFSRAQVNVIIGEDYYDFWYKR